jgi:HK97 gp10 family phage protein
MSLSEAFTKRHILNATLEITGDKEIIELLEGMRSKKMISVLRPAFRAGARIIAAEARRRVPVRTKYLWKAIKPTSARRDDSALVVMNRKVVNPGELRSKARRPYRPAYIARIVEYGGYREFANGGHQRIPKQPFLNLALNAKRQEALEKIAQYLRKEIGSPGFLAKMRTSWGA